MAYAHTFKANPHWLPRQRQSAIRAIPGEDGLPFVGNTFRMLKDPVRFGKRMIARYGPVFRNNAFGGPTVSMIGPEANELVLFDRDHVFSSEQGWGPLLNLLFPRGLMLMDFEKHRADRRVMAVAFKPSRCGTMPRRSTPASRAPSRSGATGRYASTTRSRN